MPKEEKELEEIKQDVPIEEEEISPLEDENEEIMTDAPLTHVDLTDSSLPINEVWYMLHRIQQFIIFQWMNLFKTPSSSTIPTDLNASKITKESVEGDEDSANEEMAETIEEEDAPLSPVDLRCTSSLLERVIITAFTIFLSVLTYFPQASPPQTPESPEGEDGYVEEEEEEMTGDEESSTIHEVLPNVLLLLFGNLVIDFPAGMRGETRGQ